MALQQHPTESLVSYSASLAVYVRRPSVVFRGNPVPSLLLAGVFALCDHGCHRGLDLETSFRFAITFDTTLTWVKSREIKEESSSNWNSRK